jgi:hypothetical protein
LSEVKGMVVNNKLTEDHVFGHHHPHDDKTPSPAGGAH